MSTEGDMTGRGGPLRGLVAGGAGGIGRHIVAVMVKAGYEVTIADLDPERTEQVRRDTGAARTWVGDLATEDGAREAIDVARGGDILHALVIATGISPKQEGRKRPFYEISFEEWAQVLSVNLNSSFLLCREAYPHLARDSRASIVNILSIMSKTKRAVQMGPPYSPSGAHYAASKAALHNLTKSMARELAPRWVSGATVFLRLRGRGHGRDNRHRVGSTNAFPGSLGPCGQTRGDRGRSRLPPK